MTYYTLGYLIAVLAGLAFVCLLFKGGSDGQDD